ncbi:4Fe-4S binding protein [Paenibacillus chartarius]|uniref:4Fe-4S binding protein n=1 Tax=Paenibacillus chartarius TaxID=747481 RepID=A0ABV6DTH1_9BACL
MIELISQERCVGCNQCVSVCPTNVFDETESGVPVIARQSDCQTCFMCELYCPVDALFVTPFADEEKPVEESQLQESGLLGSYRASLGWGKGRKSTASSDGSYIVFRRMAGH